ncbi:endonuclease/exonuclease/phosphatase family protein, partial [Trifolium medium]|nr:endonuclease/exonuclease/phosphatase family protein [Trifolium medium]
MELWKKFARYGRVGEVYIPSKLDKRGKRFGFVKFKEVKNLEVLSKQLYEIWCGAFKLRVNVARFNRFDAQSKLPLERHKDGHHKSEANVIEGNTFKTTLVGKQGIVEMEKCKEGSAVAPVSILPSPDVLLNLEISSVGFLVKGKVGLQVQGRLYEEGYKS